MRDILDPDRGWLGTPGRSLADLKRPVALPDFVTIEPDSVDVVIDVLANDFDPDGGALSLVSAFAALGSASVSGNTVLYTPIPNFTGPDTIVYDISNPLGATRSGQVNVTVELPALTVTTTADGRLDVGSGSGPIDLTITEPAAYAGTWSAIAGDVANGPVPIVAPKILGLPEEGETVTAVPGLWLHDAATVPSRSRQWRRGGVDIPGETEIDYLVTAADAGQTLSLTETLSDANGSRQAISGPLAIAGFTPAAEPGLIAWWDASDVATITDDLGRVSAWADKTGGAALGQNQDFRRPQTGTRSLNGLNVLDFDGTRFLERALTLPASGDVAIHMALIIDGVATAYDAVLALDAASNDMQIDSVNAAGFDGRLNAAGIGPSMSLTGGPFSGGLILSVVFDRSGTQTAEIFIADQSRGSTAYSQALAASTLLRVMGNRSGNAWVNGAVAELVITSEIATRGDHHAYLAAKWGLS